MKMIKDTLLLAALMLAFTSQAQKSIRDKDIIGEWKLKIDIHEKKLMKELEDDEGNSFFSEWVAESVVGLASDFLDELNIYFDFKKEGRVKIAVEIFGEHEVNHSSWYINKHGELIIEDSAIFNDNDDQTWIMEHDRLISYRHNASSGRDKDVAIFMVRVD